MCRFARGKRLTNGADHRPVQVQRMQYHQVFYGCLIMLFHDAHRAIRNFGWEGESIIAGELKIQLDRKNLYL